MVNLSRVGGGKNEEGEEEKEVEEEDAEEEGQKLCNSLYRFLQTLINFYQLDLN